MHYQCLLPVGNFLLVFLKFGKCFFFATFLSRMTAACIHNPLFVVYNHSAVSTRRFELPSLWSKFLMIRRSSPVTGKVFSQISVQQVSCCGVPLQNAADTSEVTVLQIYDERVFSRRYGMHRVQVGRNLLKFLIPASQWTEQPFSLGGTSGMRCLNYL